MDAPRNDRLAALTGLRFAAALGILLFHYGGPLVAAAPAWVERIRVGGHVWVGLFYLLSGFVLARAHPEPMRPAERRSFYAARAARLYPAYLLAFLLAAPFAMARWSDGGPLAGAKAALVAVAALLLVQAWVPPIARLWNAPGWSTSVVLSFYAAFPFVAARLARLSRRGLAGALAAAWLLSLAFPAAYLALRPDGPIADVSWNEPFWLVALKFHPLARAGEFLAGVALGLLDRRGLALARGGGAVAAAALAATLLVLAWGGVPYVLLHNGALVPLFALALLGIARSRGLLGRALASGPARVLGDASFALYALQEPLWLWARRLAGVEPGSEASAGFVLGYAAAAVTLAVAVSTSLERPARRALRAVLERSPGDRALEPSIASEPRTPQVEVVRTEQRPPEGRPAAVAPRGPDREAL
jgi:peptidoglycan/LPS O-acetylase OafA/YrhL